MNCLVSGGMGFIGSHLVDRLLADGHRVVVLDRNSPGKEENQNIRKYRNQFVFYRADIGRQSEIKPKYFKSMDWVFHLGGLSTIVASIEKPVEYHRVNVSGTVYLLDACRKAGIKK